MHVKPHEMEFYVSALHNILGGEGMICQCLVLTKFHETECYVRALHTYHQWA